VRIELKPEVANDAESLSAPAGDLLTRAVNSAIAGDTPVPQAWDEDDEFAGDDDDDDDDVV
jgi:hypothetical protein